MCVSHASQLLSVHVCAACQTASVCACSRQHVVEWQVAFHLQTQQPPILPPLCQLFQQSPDVLRGRPLHAGQQPKDGVLEV